MANGTSVLSTEIGAAAVAAYAIQLAQRWSKLPWITEHTAEMNVIARLITSGVAAVGVSFVWGDLASGGHTLTFTIPPLMILLQNTIHGLWHWFVQYAVQHGWGNLLSQPMTQKAEGIAPAPPAVVPHTP